MSTISLFALFSLFSRGCSLFFAPGLFPRPPLGVVLDLVRAKLQRHRAMAPLDHLKTFDDSSSIKHGITCINSVHSRVHVAWFHRLSFEQLRARLLLSVGLEPKPSASDSIFLLLSAGIGALPFAMEHRDRESPCSCVGIQARELCALPNAYKTYA